MIKRAYRIILISFLVLGCSLSSDDPKRLAARSEYFYQKAINSYQRELARDKDSRGARLGLANLYFEHGDYQGALDILARLKDQEAQKLRAYCFFKIGDYTQALGVFEKTGRLGDPEYLYYYGLTAQKQNLFDQALDIFGSIKDKKYSQKAAERLKAIRGQAREYLPDINDLPLEVQSGLKEAASKATPERYPLAGAVILLADEKTQLFPDHTLVSSQYFIIKILNERGKKDFSEIDISYDSTYERIDIEYARVIKPNGEVVVVGEKDIRDVSRYLNFPLYSNARARIISMPEIAEGAIVEYKVRTIQSQLINKKDFSLSYAVQEAEPIVFARFSVIIPKDRDLKTKILNPEYNLGNLNLDPKVREDTANKIYTWEFKDIPQIEPEADMPPVAEINPVVLVSTFKSWDEIYKWWLGLISDRIVYDQAISQKVSELIRGKNDEQEKIRAIYNYCAQGIRYVGVEYGQAGYQPHKATDIFKNKYGDCKDKAILFVAMLKCAGLEAWPVLIGTRGTLMLQRDFPAAIFNHCIAMVELKAQAVFLDITAEVCSFGDLPEDDQKRLVLVFRKDAYQILETQTSQPQDNLIEYKTDVRLNPEETVFVKRQVSSRGQPDQAQRYWLRYTPPNLIEQALKEKVQSMAVSGQLLKYHYENTDNLDQAIKLSYEFEGKNFLKSAGPARILPQLANLDTSMVAKDERRYPLELGQPNISVVDYNIDLPPGLDVKYLPEGLDVHSPWLDYFINYNLKGKLLNIRQKQIVKKTQVSKSEYPEFKKFLEELAIKLEQNVILEKKNRK